MIGSGGPSEPSAAKIFVIGQGISPTGFSRVAHELLTRLSATFSVALFAINYRGPAIDTPWPVEPNRDIGDPSGRGQVAALLARHRPDFIVLLYDVGLYEAMAEPIDAYNAAGGTASTIVYCPIESDVLAWRRFSVVARADKLVAFTEGAAMAMTRLFQENEADGARSIAVIPHGLDRTRFRPIDRHEARAQLWPDRPELKDAFLVLNANHNFYRKRLDVTIDAFAAFARARPDAYLCLHTGLHEEGFDARVAIDARGLKDRVLTLSWEAEHPNVDDETLNRLYSSCDVGINTSNGEGWGLVAFEHAATGAAQLVPNHTACAELWRDAGILLPLRTEPDALGALLVDAAAAADLLGHLYDDRDLLRRASDAARRRTLDPSLSWDAIASTWRDLLLTMKPKGMS